VQRQRAAQRAAERDAERKRRQCFGELPCVRELFRNVFGTEHKLLSFAGMFSGGEADYHSEQFEFSPEKLKEQRQKDFTQLDPTRPGGRTAISILCAHKMSET
jgi:hypothetical protein